MDMSDEQLVEELKAGLSAGGYRTAFDDAGSEGEAAPDQQSNPLDGDFFKALNAYRAARSGGDPQEMAAAEEHMRQVVRSELTGEPCE